MAAIGPESIRVTSRLAIPLSEIELRYSRSSGPGGQHAQKTETRVEAVFRPEDSETLSEAQKRRVLERAGPFVTAVAQDERSRMRNRELALERLALALAAALKTKRRRRPTKPTHASRERRLEAKKHRAQAKRLRKPPSGE
jgi:ribosome-associated protein